MSGFGSADIEIDDPGEWPAITPMVTEATKPKQFKYEQFKADISGEQLGAVLATHFAPVPDMVEDSKSLLAIEMHRLEATFGVAADEEKAGLGHMLSFALAIPTPSGRWKSAYCTVTREFIAEVKQPMRYIANRLEALAMSPEHCILQSRGELPRSMTFWRDSKPWDGGAL